MLPHTGHEYKVPGNHWNGLRMQQSASYHGTLRMMEISPSDPQLTVII